MQFVIGLKKKDLKNIASIFGVTKDNSSKGTLSPCMEVLEGNIDVMSVELHRSIDQVNVLLVALVEKARSDSCNINASRLSQHQVGKSVIPCHIMILLRHHVA